jgi:hypothetical protein
VKDLAQALDKSLLRWYETVYHFQSCDGHALNSLQHLAIQNASVKASYASTDEAVNQTLRAAIGMFLTHIQVLHQNLDFGTYASTAFASLMKKYYRLVRPGC